MAFSLYDATIANFVQILGAVSGFLDKGLSHFKEKGTDPEEIVDTRLYADMLPFRFQIVSVAHHSRGAIEGVVKGSFAPDMGKSDLTYASLQAMVAEARDKVTAVTPDTINGLVGREIIFEVGGRKLPFTAEDFLMSMSLPNFYFHATTAYDILRNRGVPLGKRDFLGRMRLKT